MLRTSSHRSKQARLLKVTEKLGGLTEMSETILDISLQSPVDRLPIRSKARREIGAKPMRKLCHLKGGLIVDMLSCSLKIWSKRQDLNLT